MDLVIAGRDIADPVATVGTWIEQNERTVRDYDLTEPPGGPDAITAQDVLLTRYTRVRIGSDELQFFVDRSHDAPWDTVRHDADLKDADPDEEDGLYDAAEELYNHFYTGRRREITFPQIHLVLHMKRRALYPLLDGRYIDLFEDAAREVSRRTEGRRGRRGRLYWAAVREEIVAQRDDFEELRSHLAGRDEPASLGASLTDVRLHDILCWTIVGR
jgi:hypothetical protein